MGKEFPVPQRKSLLGSHPGLEGCCGPFGVSDEPLFCHSSHHQAAVLHQTDTAGGHVLSQFVGNQFCPSVPVNTDQGIGGPQINSNHCHGQIPPVLPSRFDLIQPSLYACHAVRAAGSPAGSTETASRKFSVTSSRYLWACCSFHWMLLFSKCIHLPPVSSPMPP